MVGTSSDPTSLKEYLKKYTSNEPNGDNKERKKKKKAKPVAAGGVGVVVVDEDPIWQKPVKLDEDEEESADEEKPQVDEDIDVKRMRRLEQIRSKRPFGVLSEDGSGWTSVSNNIKSENQNLDISPPRKRAPQSDGSNFPVDRDISPPRKRRPRNDTPSPEPKQESNLLADNDLSPPRQSHKRYQSPPVESEVKASHFHHDRSARHDTPSPRRNPENAVSDLSPPRGQQRNKHVSSRESPPVESEVKASHFHRDRSARHDMPSPRRNLENAVSDLSPPRRQQQNKHVSSPEPGRISSHYKAATDLDISPPRRARRDSKYQDNSHASSAATDLSPPRKSKNNRSSSVVSSRKSINNLEDDHDTVPSVSDLSPPRKRKEPSISSHRPKTGLVSGGDVKEEIDRKKKEDMLRFRKMDPSVSGQGAEATYRNKLTGERMSKEDFMKSQEKKKAEKPKEIKLEWGKGLAQKREAEARLQEIETEKDKPFARTRDDPELDAMLKERIRWGDPMAHLVKKKQLDPVLPNLGDSERMKESGFIIPQEIPSHSWLRRGLDAAPNRYGIKPGRHWDGVDRSTGYEKELFKRTNEKKATETEAYLWSVADM